MTANHPDRIAHFGKTDAGMRRKMAAYILPDFPEQHDALVSGGADTTPAQFQHICIEAAFRAIEGGNTGRRAA